MENWSVEAYFKGEGSELNDDCRMTVTAIAIRTKRLK